MNLQMYYNKKAAGDRSLVARILDAVLFRAMIFTTIFIVIFYYSFSLKLALLMAIFLTAALSLVLTILKRAKRKRFMEENLKDLKEKCLLEELTFMSTDEFCEYINKLLDSKLKNIEKYPGGFTADYEDSKMYALHNHPSDECKVSDIINIYRSSKEKDNLTVLTMSDLSEDAKALCKNKNIDTINGKKVLKIAEESEMLVSEEAANHKAEEIMKESIITLKQLRKNAFSGVKIKGYIICGIITLLWPLINGFKIYYPIISVVCFALAFISHRKRKPVHDNEI